MVNVRQRKIYSAYVQSRIPKGIAKLKNTGTFFASRLIYAMYVR